MSTFKPMEYNQFMMTVLGIYPRPPNASSRLSWLHSISPYFVVFFLSAVLVLSAKYVQQEYKVENLSYVFQAFGIVVGGSEALFAYVNMRWIMDKLGDIPSKLQEVIDREGMLIL